ncbi:hypothetical protein [Candidatus Uabimicrobium amorphum]|uniref:Uncharacterized protein n=1 Tax=Uabimicrobium amorphum TaxID=2596890 RepID=A0A5S9F1P6_UABAM|nr:hypothetical protein [Candidatus Uabimicrobium amorphum]BBM82837.1 hypothetical protein UABAM_01180 [Candidatus Uabimicrobium amorphum]
MDPYAEDRELKHKEFIREHSKKVKSLDNLQVLHEVMNRYAELSQGWTRDSLVVEREMNVSKEEVLRRMEKKSNAGLWSVLSVSFIVNVVLGCLLLFR